MSASTAEIQAPRVGQFAPDHRGNFIPTWGMIRTRIMELRKRRGLMIALIVVDIGLPVIFLAIRLISHAVSPKSFGPAGGYDIFSNLVAGVMFVFGFIVAATLGCTAGSVDLSEGVFRHLVVTGRSRVALYFARIPAGLAILVPIVLVGFAIVCAVCVIAAPTKLNYDGLTVPSGLSKPALVSWAEEDANAGNVVCAFNYRGPINVPVPCGPNGVVIRKVGPGQAPAGPAPTKAQVSALAGKIAAQDYADYHNNFLSPPFKLMAQSFLWLELETAIGFIVGLGLASLMGQRTVPVVLMIVLEIVLTPLLATNHIPHLINLQRAIVGIATAHVEPNGIPTVFANNHSGGGSGLIPETTLVAYLVIAAWLVGWTALGAWRMSKRDV
ncbi:MAG TPA: hypothetical protein VIJ86_05715 [Acidimicrobiales bacterium]